MITASLNRLRTARSTSLFAAGGAHDVTYLGGSITWGAYALAGNSWVNLLSAYLDTTYASATLTHHNQGISGTPAWYGLIRYPTEVLADTPTLITLDFAVNDGLLTSLADHYKGSSEALIRRIRADLPDSDILGMFMLRVTAADDVTNSLPLQRTWYRQLFAHYQIPYVDFADTITDLVNGGASIGTYITASDLIHPTTAGHAVHYAQMRNVLSPRRAALLDRQWSGTLADYPYLHPDTAGYEAATPVIIAGKDATIVSGTWTTDGDSIISSEADAVISFTGTCQSFGFKHPGTGAACVTVDAYGWPGWPVTFAASADCHPLGLPVVFARGSHTVSLKVVSGTVEIEKFLAV